MILEQLIEITPKFLTLISAISSLTYLTFFVFLDRRQSSLIQNQILIFVTNIFFLFLSMYFVRSGYEAFQHVHNYALATTPLTSLLFFEAIFRRHSPFFFKTLTLFVPIVGIIFILTSNDYMDSRTILNYYLCFHLSALTIFMLTCLRRLHETDPRIRARILIMSKTMALISVLAIFHFVFVGPNGDLRILGIAGSLTIHSLLLSHRDKSSQFRSHPLFFPISFSLLLSTIIHLFVFKYLDAFSLILLTANVLAPLLLFEQIEYKIIRRFQTISHDFFYRIDKMKKATSLNLKEKVEFAFDQSLAIFNSEDLPIIDEKKIRLYFAEMGNRVPRQSLVDLQKKDLDLYNQFIEIFCMTNCETIYLVESRELQILGLRGDRMMATETKNMDALVLKTFIEGFANEH